VWSLISFSCPLAFIGKKHVGELSPFDLVVLLIISETVDGSLIGDDHSLSGGLISAATLVLVVQIVGYSHVALSHCGTTGRWGTENPGSPRPHKQGNYE
jgi:uncharacterized membrane protein YcaP (DUF421 family)